MEKEIYITEAPYHQQQSNQSHLARDKSAPILVPSRKGHPQPTSKLIHRLPHENYYETKQLKPGISFYKNIVEIEQKRMNGSYSGPKLNINMPDMVLLNDSTNCLIYTENGTVKFKENISNEQFIQKLGITKYDSDMFPAIIHSSISGIDFNNSVLMSNEIFANKIVPRSEGFIIRQFIMPYAATPNILRLYFTPHSCKNIRKNFGHKMIHNNSMNQQLFKKKHRQTHHYMINPQRHATYNLTTIKGKCIQPYELMAQSLTQYLQKAYPVKIVELILDFVVDQNKQPWLLEVKGIKSRNLTKLWDIGSIDEICLLAEKNNNSQLCKLCRMTFSKQQLQKLVTNKLIWEIVDHIKSRNLSSPNIGHLRKQGFSNVCELCYDIIVAEHNLIEIENQFACLLNIDLNKDKIDEINTLVNNKNIWDQEDFVGDNMGIPKLKSWRLFFYFQKIKYTQSTIGKKPVNVSLQMKFGQFRQNFTKKIAENINIFNPLKSRFSSASRAESAKFSKKRQFEEISNKEWICDVKGGMSQTTMASKISSSQLFSRQNIDIKKTKIFSFYTKKQHNNILDDAELQINLTIDDHKFEGRTLTLQQLKNRDLCQRHSSEVFLFDKKLNYCNLQLTVGLICDGQTDPDGLNLQQTDGVYYSIQPHKICLPLPNQWMQVFTKGEYAPICLDQLNYQKIKEENKYQKMIKSDK